MDSVLIVAAEASSSLYAQRLLEFWREQGTPVQAFGVGSRDMEKLGFECLGRSEEMAVMGFSEVVKHLPLIRRVYNSVLAEAEKRKPKFALLLDYPGFNLRIAKDLKKRGIKVIYYISPQIWAWRTGRVKTIRKVVDHMLVLFPFEEPFYKEHGIRVDFVGHPLLDEMPTQSVNAGGKRAHRERFGLGANDVVLGLMPGSRRAEIQYHLETQLAAARIIVKKHPNVRVMLMVAPTLDREELREAMGDVEFPVQLIKEEPLDMIALADAILVASGTATLMVGMLAKPMVIMYRMNAITAWLARRLVTKTKFFGMANLILDRLAVPELFQQDANPERIAKELETQLFNPEQRAKTIDALSEIQAKLGARGATRSVAKVLEGYLR